MRAASCAVPPDGPRSGPAGAQPGPAPAPGVRVGDRPLAVACAAFAVFAAGAAVFSSGDDRAWACWAVGGYALSAALSWRWPRSLLALLPALACAVAAPLAWLALRGPPTADVTVVARSAVLLLRHGSPYLPAGPLVGWTSYNPYLPVMAVFGLPKAAGLAGLAGDTRPWLVLATAGLLAASFSRGTPHGASRCAGCRRSVTRYAMLALASPLCALPLAVGITDPPVFALLCLALALVGRPSRPVLAGLVIGAACAMKATAWPALPVIAIMLAARDGTRSAGRFAAASVVTAGALVAATAPALVARPAAFFQNVVAFPLGLTSHATPAASPLPGHALASAGPAGRTAAIVLLAAAGLGVAAWLVARPPRDVRSAAWRLALGLGLMFALAPATRFGYFAYPAALIGWLALTGPGRALAASPQPGRSGRAVLVPAQAVLLPQASLAASVSRVVGDG